MPMEHENCPYMETYPLNRVMAFIGGKWKMQILCSLYNNGPTHYSQLKKTLDGVSSTALTNALRELRRDGLVYRQEYLKVFVRVKYTIIEPCRQLIPILGALGDQSMTLQARKGRRWSLRPDR